MSTLSIRALWIIDTSEWKIIVSRRYPTVERRARKLYHEQYQSIPTINTNETLLRSLRNQSQQNLYSNNPNNIPLINSISCRGKKIAPLISVVYTDLQVVMIAVPLMPSASAAQEALEAQNMSKTTSVFPFHRLPVITAAMSMMDDLSKYMRIQSSKELSIQAASIQAYLTQSMPFGTPTDTHPNNIRLILTRPFAKNTSLSSSSSSSLSNNNNNNNESKRPVWRIQEATRGRQRVVFYVSEQISAAQFDSTSHSDESRVSGAIHCNAELDGTFDITASINNTESVTDIRTNPCVQSSSSITTTNNNRNRNRNRNRNQNQNQNQKSVKIAFTPPSGPFTLASYIVKNPIRKFPIRGFYQMKEINERQVKILLQLKLDSQMRNEFKHLIVRIPFPNRPPISHFSLSKTSGSLFISRDGHDLLWDLGHKITSRNLEVAMPGKVYFKDNHKNENIRKRKIKRNNYYYYENKEQEEKTYNSIVEDEEEDDEEEDEDDYIYNEENNNNNNFNNIENDQIEEEDEEDDYINNNNNNNTDITGRSSSETEHHQHQHQHRHQHQQNDRIPIDEDLLKEIEASKREWEEQGDAFFGRGDNAYVSIHVQMSNTTLSGVDVDEKSLTVYPTPQSRIQSVANFKQVISGKYIIWNSLGDSKHS